MCIPDPSLLSKRKDASRDAINSAFGFTPFQIGQAAQTGAGSQLSAQPVPTRKAASVGAAAQSEITGLSFSKFGLASLTDQLKRNRTYEAGVTTQVKTAGVKLAPKLPTRPKAINTNGQPVVRADAVFSPLG